ncbi:MAG: hypothetical protein ACI90M_004919 [Candidatus Azotimanducaceae bacterium]
MLSAKSPKQRPHAVIAAEQHMEAIVEAATGVAFWARECAATTLFARLEQRNVVAAIGQAKCGR